MPTAIKTNRAEVGKKMTVNREKADDKELIVCRIKLAFPVTREEVAELTGFPQATIIAFYNEAGQPLQHASLLMTKRELLVRGRIARHIPEDLQDDLVSPDKTVPMLDLPKAVACDMRFVLEPNGAGFRGTILWKSRGDEVEDLEPLLGVKAEVDLTFEDPRVEVEKVTKAAAAAPPAAGKKTRKRRGQEAAAADDTQAPETPREDLNEEKLMPAIRDFVKTQEQTSADQLQDTFNIGFNRAHRALEQLRDEGIVGDVIKGGYRKVMHSGGPLPPAPAGVGPGFARAAQAAARKAPAKAKAKAARRTH